MDLSSFIHKKSYENIVSVTRRHFVTFIPTVLLFIILFFAVPPAIYFLLFGMAPALLTGPVSMPILILAGSVYELSILLFFYAYFVEFYLDLTIVTNDRLVDVNQSSLFARTIAEVDLYQIQDATSEIKGIFPTIFNYGNINLQTAGPVGKFILESVSDPHHLRQKILDLASEDKKFHNQ